MATPTVHAFIKAQQLEELTDNTIIVIAGASGDLAQKFLFPALFTLYSRNLLPQRIAIVGYARSQFSHDAFIAHATGGITDPGNDPHFQQNLTNYKEILSYFQGSYTEADKFQALNTYLETIEAKYQNPERNRVFYLALPSSSFSSTAEGFKKYAYASGVNRLVVEKPIGSDLESALRLVAAIAQNWSEEETFRIDHFLGQETVRNLLVFRFGNALTSGIWDNKNISNVQIILDETFGIGDRGGFYDPTGVIRDVIQNHLCQVLTVLTMERPDTLDAAKIIDKKVELLNAIPPIANQDVLLGQYEGYTDEQDVPSDSTTATFGANTLYINNERWQGVPFILRSGKKLHEDNVDIRIQFKDVASGLFESGIGRSELSLRLEPGQAITFRLNIKTPGFDSGVLPTNIPLEYKTAFPDTFIPAAYEVLLRDILRGDHATFVRDDELEAAWKVFTPILHWIDGDGGDKPTPTIYAQGARGPAELDQYLAARGFRPQPGEVSVAT